MTATLRFGTFVGVFALSIACSNADRPTTTGTPPLSQPHGASESLGEVHRVYRRAVSVS